MRPRLITAALLLASLTLSLPALAEDDQRQRAPVEAAPIAERAPVNAALRYWPIWIDFQNEHHHNPQAMVDLAFTGDASAEARAGEEVVRRRTDTIEGLISASRLPTASWGIEVENGPGALIPHLSHLRGGHQLLLADARRLIQEGDGTAAAERFAASFRMAGHARDDHEFLICSLVSIVMFEKTAQQTLDALDAGALDADARRTIVVALDRFPASDPFGTRASFQEEGVIFIRWLRAEAASNDAGRREALIHFFGTFDESDAEAMTTVRSLLQRKEPLDSYFWLLEKAYKEADDAWVAPDAEKALADLGKRIGSGEYGPIAKVFFPAQSSAKNSDTRAQSTLTALRNRLAQP